MAHEDTRDAVFPANLAQPSNIIASVLMHQGLQRLRGDSKRIRQRQTDPLSPVVNRQDAWRRDPRLSRFGLQNRVSPGE
jgi:hypothetical protein